MSVWFGSEKSEPFHAFIPTLQREEMTMTLSEKLDLVTRLETAAENVRWLLDHPDGLVDMHGLKYWAGVVEQLRKEMQ